MASKRSSGAKSNGKTSGSPAKPATPKPKPKPKNAAQVAHAPLDAKALGDLDTARVTLLSFQRDYAPPATHLEEALRSRVTDAKCRALGDRTRAVAVLAQLVKLLAGAKNARAYAALPGYSDGRLGFLVGLGLELVAMMSGARDRRAEVGDARASASSAKKRRQQAVDALVHAMDSFAGERDDEKAALTRARARHTSDGADAIAPLTKLARQWLARTDDVSRALAKDAGLAEGALADVETSAAAEGKVAGARAAKGGSLRTTDSPEVNTVEGRVVYELRALLSAIKAARASNAKIEVPKIDPSLKHVLGGDLAAQKQQRAAKRAGKEAAKKKPAAPSPPA